jgi:glyoxylase-like metal-dependent hydrolase (beta-lactamase superfamily II)
LWGKREFLYKDLLHYLCFSLICFSFSALLAGDILFNGSVGRTDNLGGDMNQLLYGIKTKLFTLPEDTYVYPGHGMPTTIKKEKATNPFFNLYD